MLLNCPHCNAAIPSTEINIPDNIAKCAECNQVFRISDAVDNSFNNEHKTHLIMPQGIEVIPGLQLDIKLKWRLISRVRSYFFIGTMFTAIPLVGIVALTSNHQELPFFVPFVLGLFLLIGVYFLFKAISFLINTTYLSVTAFELRSEHRPINFLGWKNLQFSRDQVAQLYVERYEESRTNDRADYAYNVLVFLKNKEIVKLISGLKNPRVAFYLEHQIEKYMGLKDRPMEGEYIPGQRDPRLMLEVAKQLEKMPAFLQRIVKDKLEKEQ